MVEITPEVQAQLNEQKQNCIFCKIISKEQESQIVYEDDLVIGTLDINPWVKGHTLLMPKEHYPIIPYLPAETFKHMFGLIPQLTDAFKGSLIVPSVNVLIANGGPAGQQSPHFLIHLLPRDSGDTLNKFEFFGNVDVEDEEVKSSYEMLKNNLPIMMGNHFKRNPAKWHNGSIPSPEHLSEIKKEHTVIYEDEKALCVIPHQPLVKGHLVVFSQEEKTDFDKLDRESGSHLFYVASFAATGVFEGLQAHGSNIVLKSGLTDDNQNGMLALHILPRYDGDGLDILGTVLEPKPNMDEIAERIKDKTFIIQHNISEPEESSRIDVAEMPDTSEMIKDILKAKNKPKEKSKSSLDEIQDAIKRLKGK
tara:strand:+ start:517 stop:1611 length:1095 start_codon:yes stop_codon:yes gene_type:complete